MSVSRSHDVETEGKPGAIHGFLAIPESDGGVTVGAVKLKTIATSMSK